MITLLTMLHVIICIALVMVVLMQSAKGEGLAGAFGGSGITGAVFGGRGAATFLSKATTVLAIAFFLSCIVLSFLAPTGGSRAGATSSGVQREAQKRATQGSAPATSVPGTAQQGTPQAPSQQSQTPPAGGGK
ncbi:MAG: preprotein translocase subunit SecG [Candidatus Zixiibacteriota bacterium]